LIWINSISHARCTIGSFRDGSAQDARLEMKRHHASRPSEVEAAASGDVGVKWQIFVQAGAEL